MVDNAWNEQRLVMAGRMLNVHELLMLFQISTWSGCAMWYPLAAQEKQPASASRVVHVLVQVEAPVVPLVGETV